MNQHNKINYLEFPSKDLDRTKEFFSKVFSWEFEDFGNEYTAIHNAGLDGGFYKCNEQALTSDGSVLVIIYSAELESTLNKIESSGGEITKPIFSFPGGRRFHFSDPSGNEFAVWSEPVA